MSDDRRNVWYPPQREMTKGHRVSSPPGAVPQDFPIATRRFPAWWWPFEIMARWQARAARHLSEELRHGSEQYRGHP
jgi:hypothetical protein